MILYIFVAIALVTGFRKSYAIDPGQHIRAKIWNVLTVIFFLLMHLESISFLFGMILHPTEFTDMIPEAGFLSDGLEVIHAILLTILGLVILWVMNFFLTRKDEGIHLFLKVLPFWAFLVGFSLYSGMVEGDNTLSQIDHIILLIISETILGLLAFLFYRLYNGKMMMRFLTFDTESNTRSQRELNSLIKEIGNKSDNNEHDAN